MILSFYVWRTRTHPHTRRTAWRGSCLPGVSARVRENLIEPLLATTAPHFTASFTCHQAVTITLDPRLTWQLSPPLAAKLPYHLGIAVMLAPDVTPGISPSKADTWPTAALSSSSLLRSNPHRPPLHLALWRLHFLQLKAYLCSGRLRITFTPCAAGDADTTWHNTKEEGILIFATRLTLLCRCAGRTPWQDTQIHLLFRQRALKRLFSRWWDLPLLKLFCMRLLLYYYIWGGGGGIKQQWWSIILWHKITTAPWCVHLRSNAVTRGKQETQGHGQVHPGHPGISSPSGTLTFLKDDISYYLLSSLLWFMNLNYLILRVQQLKRYMYNETF